MPGVEIDRGRLLDRLRAEEELFVANHRRSKSSPERR